MNWENAFALFKRYLKLERNAASNTVESYLRDLEKLKNYAKNLEEISPITISEEIIQQFVYDLHNVDYNERSQARLISSFKSFFAFLILDHYREDNPTERLEAPKLGIYLPDTLEFEEVNLILNAVDLSLPLGHRNKAILEVLYGTGIRVSELINLKISDLYFNDGIILVTGKGNKQRLIPIAKHTIKYVNLYKDLVRKSEIIEPKYQDFLFLNRRKKPLSRIMIFNIIKEISKIAGIEKNISPHTFRHSYATHLLQNGADIRSIQMLLGHESITTTEIYTHLNDKMLRDTILKYHPRA